MPHAVTFPRLVPTGAQYLWEEFLALWHVPYPVARRLWTGMGRSAHPEAQTLRYLFGRVLALPSGPRRTRALLQLYGGPAAPTKLIQLLDNARQAGWCDKADVDAVTELLLTSTTKTGQWTWLPQQGGSRGV